MQRIEGYSERDVILKVKIQSDYSGDGQAEAKWGILWSD